MGDRIASPVHHDLLALVSGLEVGTTTIASEGFVGLVGRTGLSMRPAGPRELDTVRVWTQLAVPATRSPAPALSASAEANAKVLEFVSGLNRTGRSVARFFHAGSVPAGEWIVAESVVAYVGEGDGAALAHTIWLFELEVNTAALAIARVFS